MNVQIDELVWKTFPNLKLALFVYSGNINYGQSDNPLEIANRITSRVRNKYGDPKTLSEHYLNDLYSTFYSKMEIKIKEISTPLKQAARFIKTDYKNKNLIIDTCMEIEYLTGVSFQLYDANKVGDSVRYSIVADELVLLSTDGEIIQTPSTGNNPKFSLDEDTRKVLVRLMGVPGISDDAWSDAIAEVSKLDGAFVGPAVSDLPIKGL